MKPLVRIFKKLKIKERSKLEERNVYLEIEKIAKKFEKYGRRDIDADIEKLSKEYVLEDMKKVVHIYFKMIADSTNSPNEFAEICSLLCSKFGEDICSYIDELAFDSETEFYRCEDVFVGLLCEMALTANIRKNETLRLISKHIDDFDYTPYINSFYYLKNFSNNEIVKDVFERNLDTWINDYQTFLEILELYHFNYPIAKYLPHLERIVLHASKENYNFLNLCHIMKKHKSEKEYKAFNHNGKEISFEECIIRERLKAAALYYSYDKKNEKIQSYLLEIIRCSPNVQYHSFAKRILNS